MNARISTKPLTEEEIKSLVSFKVKNAVETVVSNEKGFFESETPAYTVALWNFGAKNSTIANLNAQGYNVISIPASASAEDIMALNVDGIVISDGPGEPAENGNAIQEIKKLLGKKPVLGLGLGHQLIALALGAKTCKHKYGHRGSNQPVKCVKSGNVYISTQNHGYDVVTNSITQGEVLFVNVNDNSCEGIVYESLNTITVQFVPEACSIGNPLNPVYSKFVAFMEKEKANA